MEITLHEITIRELVEGYRNTEKGGVWGYDELLNIRPAYQREMVYTADDQVAVIESILEDSPIGIMYWAKNPTGDPDSPYEYEVIDGQQRTISICEFVSPARERFAVKGKTFTNLDITTQKKILDYKILVYFCEGTGDEKLKWFHRINIPGKSLFPQELRNASYTGPWLESAKKYFRNGGAAYDICSPYLSNGQKKDWLRWNGLQLAISWAANCSFNDDDAISKYMLAHQNDENADPLFTAFRDVFDWIEDIFVTKKKDDKFAAVRAKALVGSDWKEIYDLYHKRYSYDTTTEEGKAALKAKKDDLEEKVIELFADTELDSTKSMHGIYWYVLDPVANERKLNLRRFSDSDRATLFAEQGGRCPVCHMSGEDKQYDMSEMQADHIMPWSKGGKTVLDNGAMLCSLHNNLKDNKIVSEQQVKKALNELRCMTGYPARP